MSYKKRIKELQMNKIVEYMESNRKLMDGLLSNSDKSRCWHELAEELNRFDKATLRSTKKWKTTWSAFKTSVKSKIQEQKENFEKTGGDWTKVNSLTNLEERVADLMGIPTLNGLERHLGLEVEVELDEGNSNIGPPTTLHSEERNCRKSSTFYEQPEPGTSNIQEDSNSGESPAFYQREPVTRNVPQDRNSRRSSTSSEPEPVTMNVPEERNSRTAPAPNPSVTCNSNDKLSIPTGTTEIVFRMGSTPQTATPVAQATSSTTLPSYGSADQKTRMDKLKRKSSHLDSEDRTTTTEDVSGTQTRLLALKEREVVALEKQAEALKEVSALLKAYLRNK